MPTYVYECRACDHQHDSFHHVDSFPKVEKCQRCHKLTATKIITADFNLAIPPSHQACPNKLKYYGVKDIQTGEGITKDTDVRDPPGIKVNVNSFQKGNDTKH